MAADQRDRDWFVSLWVEEARLFTSPKVEVPSREILWPEGIGGLIDNLDQYLKTFHQVGNHRCWSGTDGVSGETYCTAHHLQEGPTGLEDYVMIIRYKDRYERRDADWFFSERRVNTQWTLTLPLDSDGRQWLI